MFWLVKGATYILTVQFSERFDDENESDECSKTLLREPVVNFNNILRAALTPILLRDK